MVLAAVAQTYSICLKALREREKSLSRLERYCCLLTCPQILTFFLQIKIIFLGQKIHKTPHPPTHPTLVDPNSQVLFIVPLVLIFGDCASTTTYGLTFLFSVFSHFHEKKLRDCDVYLLD